MMKKLFISFLAFLVAIFVSVSPVRADTFKDPPSVWLNSLSFGDSDVDILGKARSWQEVGKELVPAVFSLLFLVILFFTLFMIVRAGLMFIFAQGEKEHLVKARSALVNAFIGMALIFGVFLVFNLVQLFLGVNLANNGIFGIGRIPINPYLIY